MKPDAALELVEAYLRVNGYFVITEMELHAATPEGYRTLTDIDILAVRLPSRSGTAHYHDGEGTVECLLAGEVDPALEVATDRVDLIIGEVKRGPVEINSALRNPRVLHAVLMRAGDVGGADSDGIVDALIEDGRFESDRGQVRLAAFGSRGSARGAKAMHHSDLVTWLNAVLARHRELFEITNFSDPVMSLLALAARIDSPLAVAPDGDVEAPPR